MPTGVAGEFLGPFIQYIDVIRSDDIRSTYVIRAKIDFRKRELPVSVVKVCDIRAEKSAPFLL